MPRKRTYEEMENSEPPHEKKEMSLLHRIRNTWEFACVMQYIFTFGKAMKIDEDFDIEDFEEECLKPGYSEKLEEIGLNLLKWISSHRGLNHDIWDEYTRRQYMAKAPHLNPYGDEEEPKKFREFDIFTKIRILHQLTVWTFWNPDRLRERMPEHQREVDQLDWRVEEFGYDSEDRNYYLLDDNRLYRRTEPPLPPVPKKQSKANTKKAQAARRRASKRRRIADSPTPDVEVDDDGHSADIEDEAVENSTTKSSQGDTFGGYQWECVAISLQDYQHLCESLKRTRDPNEKALRERLIEDVIPIIEAAAEKQRRKIERRERELLALEKMATAKRSSRIADKQERDRRDADAAEAEKRRAAELAAAHREQERQEQMEADRQSRMMTREQRIKDREYKRILKEEELLRHEEEQKRIEQGETRGSERAIKDRLEKAKKELESLSAEEDWTFDCSGCGVHGKNIDDGSHSVACEKCNVWQHSKCIGISKSAADKADFHFVCRDCKRKEEEASRPRISLKFKVGSSSPAPPSPAKSQTSPQASRFVGVEIPKYHLDRPKSQGSVTNGHHPFSATSPPQKPSSSQAYPQPQFIPYQYHNPASTSQSSTSRSTNQPAPSARPPTSTNHQPASNGQRSTAQQYAPIQPGPRQQNTASAAPSSTAHSPQLFPTPHHEYRHQQGDNQYRIQSYQAPAQAIQQTPQQVSTQFYTNGQTPNTGRLPSPVLNRPVMTPSQGNYDVGPVAGIAQNSSPMLVPRSSSTPVSNTSSMSDTHFGLYPSQTQATPVNTRISATPTPQQLSGLSPTKQRVTTPLPPPSNVPMKMSMSPPPPTAHMRSVSGTPIFPPSQKFAPSPEQLHKTPVPTPSKQPTPAKMGEDELRRVSEEMEGRINGVQHEPRLHS